MKYILILVVLGLAFWLWRSQTGTKANEGALPLVGSPAPAFDLKDTRGVHHKLADYKGRWLVVYFYPKADTPGCTRESCKFRDDWHSFQEMGVVLVGISADKPADNAAFALKFHLPFPLLSDTGGEFARQYGARMNLGITGFPRRYTYIIDPDGRIAQVYTDVSVSEHSAEVLADLRRLTAH
ncbi:MAG: redoxin domain-containing protein [Fluviibacter sp.]